MDSRDKKALFCTYLDQAVNSGQYAAIERIFHPAFQGSFPDTPEPVSGIEGITQWTERLRTAFPDVNTVVEGNWLVSEDDAHHVGKGNVAERLAAYVVLRGSHNGDYAGAPASGKTVTWQQVHLVEFHDGQIIRDTVISDRLTFYAETGALSVPGTIPGALPIPELI